MNSSSSKHQNPFMEEELCPKPDLAFEMGQAILERVREVGQRIEGRIRRVLGGQLGSPVPGDENSGA